MSRTETVTRTKSTREKAQSVTETKPSAGPRLSVTVDCKRCKQSLTVTGDELSEMLARLDQAHDSLQPQCPNVGVPTMPIRRTDS